MARYFEVGRELWSGVLSCMLRQAKVFRGLVMSSFVLRSSVVYGTVLHCELRYFVA